MVSIKDITNHLEALAPLAYQENYDNAGLIVGDKHTTVKGVLICVDVTDEVLQEAQAKNCNLIICHHPILFQPIRKLNGNNHVARCIIQAIKHDIVIYAIHTNLDNISQGLNQRLGQLLGLEQLKILSPKSNTLSRLTTFIPDTDVEPVLHALHAAGAGHIGKYSHCSFVTKGDGRFIPHSLTDPYIGEPHQLTKVAESRVEVIFSSHLSQPIVKALKQAHPYEEVAYYIEPLSNTDNEVGSGMVGVLQQSMHTEDFLQYVKKQMNLLYLRHTKPIDRVIKKVAICGGAGSFLIAPAYQQQVDALITADLKYHDFFNADNHMLLLDIGHYESETVMKDLIYDLLTEKFTNITCLKCQTTTNPVYYC